MADSDKVILLKIEVAQAQANANVKKLEASLNNLDGRTKEYTLTLKKLQLERAKSVSYTHLTLPTKRIV